MIYPTPADITGPPFYLLEIYFGEQVFRFTSGDRVVDLADSQGNRYLFKEPFDLESFSESVELWSTALPTQSISLTLRLDVVGLLQKGFDLSCGKAVLYKAYPGVTQREKTFPILKGVLQEHAYLPDGTFSFTIYSGQTDGGSIFSEKEKIDENTFDKEKIPENALNQYYPIIYGSPGYGAKTLSGFMAGLIGYNAVYDSSDEIAARPIVCAGAIASDVKVWFDDKAGQNLVLANDTDLLGQTYTYIDLTDEVYSFEEGTSFYAGFKDISDDTKRGAGEVLLDLFLKSTVDIDYSMMAGLVSRLNRYKIDVQITEQGSPYAWTADNILQHLPISVGQNGIGIYFIDWLLSLEKPLTTLTIGLNCDIIEKTPVYWSDESQICNDILIQAAYGKRKQKYNKTIRLSGKEKQDPLLIKSYQRHGQRLKEVQLNAIIDDGTIGLIMQGYIKRYALRYRILQYQTSYRYDWLNIGDTITIIDGLNAIDNKKAVITGKTNKGPFVYFVMAAFDWA